MNKKQHITKAAMPRLTTFALASVAAFAAVQSATAGVVAPADDWYESPDWNLDVALVGDSASASSTGQAALEVSSSLNATIAETGSWTGLELEDPLAIGFVDYGMLTLGGDLTVATDYQTEVNTFVSGAVGFFNGGVLSGDGNITIASNSQNSIAPLVLTGVYSNDIALFAPDDAVESEGGFESGSLDISGYSGAIVVTNDNSVGPATVGEGTGLPIPLPIDIDLTKSAVAIGVAAVESDPGLNLGTVYGSLDQVVTTTAKSRNAEAFVTDAEEGDPTTDAVTAAAAVGALGAFVDGVGSTANITTAATSGSAVSDAELDYANALTVGLAFGLGGVVAGIEDGATITTTSNSGFAQATSDDNIAYSNTVAIAAGVVGLVYASDEELIDDAVESDAPAVTTITTTAESDTSSAAAAGPAEAASGAIAVGMGGLIEDLSNTTLTTTATSGVVTAESSEYSATGLSISAAVGVVGQVGGLDGTTITSNATSATASATESDFAASATESDFAASATTLSIAGGVLGGVNPEAADVTLDATATAADATATGRVSAAASADAIAFGVADFEILYYALESVGPIFGDPFLGDILGDGLGSFLGDAVVADVLADPLEPIAQTIALDLGVTANAKNATATIVFNEEPEAPVESDEFGGGSAYASASALAVGTSDLGGEGVEITGTVDVTANAAIATASGDGYSEAEAYASAYGLDDVYGKVSAAISLTAGAAIVRDLAPADAVEGSEVESVPVESSPVAIAAAYNAFGGEAHADASAYTTGINGSVYGNEEGDDVIALSGSFTQNAFGGVAVAESYDDFLVLVTDAVESGELEEESSLADSYDVSASAVGDSFGVDGDVSGDVTADFTINATGGEAYASGSAAQALAAEAYGDAAGIYGSVDGDFDATMNVTATGGKAIVETVNLIDSPDGLYADASAIATGIGGADANANAIDGDVAGTINVTAIGGKAGSLNYSNLSPLNAVESVYVVEEEFDGLYVAEGAFNAYAQAVGLNGNVDSEVVSAAITATATGGEVVIANTQLIDDAVEADGLLGGSAGAFAAGIAGQEVIIDDVTGDITATATAGTVGYADFSGQNTDAVEGEGFYLPDVPDLAFADDSNADRAFAAGIMAYTPNVSVDVDAVEGSEPVEGGNLDVTISSAVHAYAISPFSLIRDAVESEEVSGPLMVIDSSYAAAVYGAQAGDSVELDDGADIIGDINLGGGVNELKVIGNSTMEGNILSTSLEWIDYWLNIDNGAGTVDFDVDSGYFTAVRTVEVSDLFDTLVIGASGGLAPILSQDPEDGDTSLVAVSIGNGGQSANVQFEAGSSILPVFAETVDLNNVVGNEYAIVMTQDGAITDGGAVVDNSETPFEYSFEVRGLAPPADAVEGIIEIPSFGEEGVLTVLGVKDQDGEETPGTVQTNQAVNSSSQAVMIDISKHAALLRTSLRSSAQAPAGASGPEAEKMQNGEWLSYISVFGNIGQQETSGGFAGFDYDTYGLVVGQEKLVGEQLIVGIGGGYAQTDIDGLDGSGGGDSELYSLAVYANWFTDTWYAEGGLTYGHADSDVVRIDIMAARYTGNYDSNLIGTWFELGYTSAFGDFGLEPYGRVTYIHGEHDGFTDSGPDALVLTTQDNETDNFKTEFGARLNHEWAYESGSSVLVEVKAGWEHEWGDEGVSVNSSYLGDSSLTLQSAQADTDAIVLGIRGEWSNGEGLSFGLEYEPTFSGNWYNHAFSGTLRYNW